VDVIGFAVELQYLAPPAMREVAKYRVEPGENGGVDAPPSTLRNEN
jgi:hypothetical protein